MSVEKSTESLIDNLAQDLTPQRPMVAPIWRSISWIVITALYLLACLFLITGIRHDLSVKLADPFFLFETSLMALIAVSSAFISHRLSVPDLSVNTNDKIPVALTSAFLLWVIVRMVTEGVSLSHLHLNHCILDGMLFGAIPIAAILFTVKRGAPIFPLKMAAMNSLSVAAFGYIALRFSCSLDTIEHGCFCHFLPYILTGIVIGFSARKLYKW